MEVITTHLNADFDAFASMVAAKKLYPDAVMAFPGSQEKSLRDFFIESTLYILAIERAKTIDLEDVDKLILVDTRQKSRIGRFASIVDSDHVQVHIYDHHPASEDDAKGHVEVIREVGATVTLISRDIRMRGIEIDSEEATILALGIYEDTGSFTFPATTAEDMDAAAWLLAKGANLNIISNMMNYELNRDQIELLHQFIEESEIVHLGGIDVLVCTASVEGYVADLAVVVHKFRDMENPDAVFALVRMENRVHLVGRSRVPEVNAGEIAAEFGGGGHHSAASATITDLSLYPARDELIRLLHKRVQPKREARQIMSRPVIAISPDENLGDAAEFLSRYQITSLPVTENGRAIGILHRNSLDKAIHHGLNEAAVREYMDTEVPAVGSHDSIDAVMQMALEGRHRLVLVVDRGEPIGVISRTDLLEHMKLPRTRDSAGPSEFPAGRMKSKNIRKLMEEMLPKEVLDILLHAGEVAQARGEEVYLVGGAVRDILLRNPNLDIDLVVEGDGIAFAKELAKGYEGCKVKGHEKFGTAVIRFRTDFKIDVASARHEYYARPGALPTVEMSSIKRDLYRRDFTINTLAVSLNPSHLGRVIDFFGGGRDIKDRVLRVLHNLAFVEDPTRLLRAVRFSSRFGFTIAKHTQNLMKSALKMNVFEKVEGKRLLNELIHLLEEKAPVQGMTLMEELRILHALHPTFEFTVRTRDLVESVSGVLAWWNYLFIEGSLDPWLVYFLALTHALEDDEFLAVMNRFSFSPSRALQLSEERIDLRRALAAFVRGSVDRPSQAYRLLKHLSLESLLFMMAFTSREQTRKYVSDFITKWRYVKPQLKGKDLIGMGYEPGPAFHAILEAVRDASLDEVTKTAEDERMLVSELFPLGSRQVSGSAE